MKSHAFVLRRLSDTAWVIDDNRYRAADAHHAIAWIEQRTDGRVDTTWLQDLPLPVTHDSAVAAMRDVVGWWG